MPLADPVAVGPEQNVVSAETGPEKIFLVRHGQSIWNKNKRVSGQIDVPLAPAGSKQAFNLSRVLQDQPLTAIYASDLSRAVDTAAPTAGDQGLVIHHCRALREQHLGVLQGRYRDARDREAQILWQRRKADMTGFQVTSGETWKALCTRILHFLAQLLAGPGQGTVLIVGHRNTNRVLLAALLGWDPQQATRSPIRSRWLYEITRSESPSVRSISLRAESLGRQSAGLCL